MERGGVAAIPGSDVVSIHIAEARVLKGTENIVVPKYWRVESGLGC